MKAQFKYCHIALRMCFYLLGEPPLTVVGSHPVSSEGVVDLRPSKGVSLDRQPRALPQAYRQNISYAHFCIVFVFHVYDYHRKNKSKLHTANLNLNTLSLQFRYLLIVVNIIPQFIHTFTTLKNNCHKYIESVDIL